jgi:hypothetical protein
MTADAADDADALRAEVRSKYREVATNPHGTFHFHTGRPLAARLGYEGVLVDALPDVAVESFTGVANPFSLQSLRQWEHVVDVGSGVRSEGLRYLRSIAAVPARGHGDAWVRGRRRTAHRHRGQVHRHRGTAGCAGGMVERHEYYPSCPRSRAYREPVYDRESRNRASSCLTRDS